MQQFFLSIQVIPISNVRFIPLLFLILCTFNKFTLFGWDQKPTLQLSFGVCDQRVTSVYHFYLIVMWETNITEI